MAMDWLWDRKISLRKVKSVLKDDQNIQFVSLCALLLSRKNIPKEVFGVYLDKQVFVQNWHRIKKQMRKDQWNSPRIVFWQAIYEKLLEIFKDKGVIFRKPKSASSCDEFCRNVGKGIKEQRRSQDLSQKDLAKKLGISQQIISRIERGGNTSLLTIKKIADVLNKIVSIQWQ
ncbi:hypothetical protein MNBD_UNCLBAC01-1472 [hydrothermal vent metagenome]|uniref:HTH cro/C1-type domain-containing protein n=1 Tax=hydrothermal vent metagenome TaxID=652676 RepID=A0A3B1DDB4_9ZZZZ